MRFDNQVVLVTGSARGIGYVIAEKFLGCGATVVISDLRQEDVDKAVEQLAATGGKVSGYECNVTSEDSVNALVDRVVAELGQLDVLVNNAGITRDTLALRMKIEQWQMVLDTNLTGTFLCSRAAIKHMIRARAGRIINISSVMGLIGNAGQCNYSASKAGVLGLTRSLAREVASRNVLVNAIAPGFIHTAMTDAIPEKARQTLLDAIPVGRMGEPEDIANAALFLASDMASYITGEVISVNGGGAML